MIVSTLRRTTAIADHEEWERRKARLLERLQPLLERQPGFAGVEVERGDGGSMSETTSWHSMENCRHYVRGGAAATAATISDAFLPTAPYPNGAWLRETKEDPAES